MRIGIYGGTFNPVHSGHLHILKVFISRLRLDRVIVVPVLQPPHKEAEDLAPPADRLKMCELAFSNVDDRIEVSDIEIRREGKSYTVDTVSQIEENYPGSELFLIMGEDMFVTFGDWRAPQQIADKAVICVAPRSIGGSSRIEMERKRLEKLYGARIIFEDINFLDISSTKIREKIAGGRDIGLDLPQAVKTYIVENRLYAGENL